ncbi:MAG TPA: radical SAM protein [Kineosporiaceae bacterium]|nr:radical SAM protein [Kineosporiaceae bacterium]
MTDGYVAGTVPFSAVDGPGNRYVVFLQGCGFDCLTCHNPGTIPVKPAGMTSTSVAQVLSGIREDAAFLTGVTVTGGEATLQPDFVHDLFAALAADPVTARLSRFVDSNGDADPQVWQRLATVTDGVMLDLKALDDETHLVLTGSSNERVLASVVDLAGRGLLYEVRLLFVPGLNDDDATLKETAAWLLEVDPAIRIRLIAMRRRGTRSCAQDLLEPTGADLQHYHDVLAGCGVARFG